MWLLFFLCVIGFESRGIEGSYGEEGNRAPRRGHKARRAHLKKKQVSKNETRPHSPLDAYEGHARRHFGAKGTTDRLDQNQGDWNFKAALQLMEYTYERPEDEKDAIALAENLLVSAPMYGCPVAYVPQAQLLMRPLLLKFRHLPVEERAEKLNDEPDWKSAQLLLKLAISEGSRQKIDKHLLGWAHLSLSCWYGYGHHSLKYKQKEQIHSQLAAHYGFYMQSESQGSNKSPDQSETEEEAPLFHVPHLETEMEFTFNLLNAPMPSKEPFDFLKPITVETDSPGPIDMESDGTCELMGFMGLL